jgi:23S rRNA pseudouridine1911/1915/1917 synthase
MTAAKPTIVVELEADSPRDRLDRAVVSALDSIGRPVSRATAQRWIEEGRVRVDDVERRASAWPLRNARVLAIDPLPPPPSQAEPDASVRLSIVYEDDALLVVDKPAGLVVHPARGHATGTLVNGLLAHESFDAKRAGEDASHDGMQRPGIVHRLDRGTSGLLVVAKTESAREHLKAQFAAHSIEREYVAIVVGAAKSCTIDSLHGRHPTDRLRFTSLGTPAGAKRAVTHVRLLETLTGASVVACRLETGRTHQIRVHLSERAGAPILGDPTYGQLPRAPTLASIARELGHQALHARVLGLVHPNTGATLRWESAPHADFQRAWSALRSLTKASTSRAPST